MSTKRTSVKKMPLRRGRNRRTWLLPDVDIPLPIATLLTASRTPKNKKKSTPRKRPANARAGAPAAVAAADIVNLDDTCENVDVLNNVDSKIGNFMQTGSFISSDEDETEMIKAKTNKKPSPNPFFISDDSDDDCKLVKPNSSNFDFSTPSTSAGTINSTFKDNNLELLNDDIMDIVDSVLEKKNKEEQSPLKDMKSLEDYRKETEEMLKNATSLLDEIKTGRKLEAEEKKRESSPAKVTVGSCPVCLESLASRAASVTVCGHIFCKECILQTAQTLKKCPTCRKGINMKKIHPIYL